MTIENPSQQQVYPVTPYKPDGGYTLNGVLLLVLSMILAGAAMGFVVYLISQLIYLILIFPILIGLALGAIGARVAKSANLRNPVIGGIAGLLGGIVAMVMVHYFDYQEFKGQIEKLSPEWKEFAQLPPDQQKVAEADLLAQATDREKAAEFLHALRIHDFPHYIDYQAEQGVQIKSTHGGSGKGLNLGYYGSYIYWLVELGIVAGFTFGLVKTQAGQPFCADCMLWKKPRMLGLLAGPPQPAIEGVNSGELAKIVQAKPAALSGDLDLSVVTCPNCGRSSAEVQLQATVVDKEGKKSRKTLAQASWPADAVPALEALFVRKPPAAPPAPSSAPTATATPSASAS
jgi:hypothetical protein